MTCACANQPRTLPPSHTGPPTAPGETQFCANVTDGAVFTTACVNIRVDPPGPVATDDTYTCAFGVPCTVTAGQGLLANDASPANLALSVVGNPSASVGTLVVDADGSFVWTPPSS